jgi:hypothetical protein
LSVEPACVCGYLLHLLRPVTRSVHTHCYVYEVAY